MPRKRKPNADVESLTEDSPRSSRERLNALAQVAGRFSRWKPATEVLTSVVSQPTIFPLVNRATGIGGWPLQRVTLVHGPSSHGKTALMHGIGLSFLKRGNFYCLIDAEHCYDKDTEVLTRRGFIPWPQVTDEDMLGCWDEENQSLVYEKPEYLTRDIPKKRRMYRVDHGAVDLLVTAEHTMFIKTLIDKRSGDSRTIEWTPSWSLMKAQDLDARTSIRYRKHCMRRISDDPATDGLAARMPPHDDPLALLRLIGFFVGDGWVGRERGRRNGISFTLRKQRKITFLREICMDLGWDLDEMSNGVYVVRAPNIGQIFREQFYSNEGEKVIPEWLLDPTFEEASALLDGLRESDGTLKRKTWEYVTSSEQVAQAVQRIVLHAGGCAHISEGEVFRVMVLTRTEAVVNGHNRKNTSWVEYDGEVYCAKTRTGILVVRRNGKPVLSGNTTPKEWLASLMTEEFAKHPGFRAIRPKSYEATVDAVREMLEGLAEAKAREELPEDTSALIVVDSVRKLLPDKLAEKLRKSGSEKEGIDGMKGRSSQIRAKMNAEWLDELVPSIYHANASMTFISREYEAQTDPRDMGRGDAGLGMEYKVSGGKALIFESSLVCRVTRSWVYDGTGENKQVVGERCTCRFTKTKVSGHHGKWTEGAFHISNGVLTPAGFDRARDVMELALSSGAITQNGAYFNDADGGRWHGTKALLTALVDQPSFLAAVEEKCRG